jgi:hypothetical protein
MQTECLVCGLGSCLEGHLVWLQNRNLDWGVMELNQTLMHTHEKMKTCSPQSDSAADDSITTFTWLTDSTHCWPAVPFVNRFTRLWQRHLTLLKTIPHLPLACSSFVKWYYCWWKRETDIITIPWHIGQMTVPTAWGDCAKNVLVFGNYYANEAYHRDTFKITGQHKNGFTWPFTVTL